MIKRNLVFSQFNSVCYLITDEDDTFNEAQQLSMLFITLHVIIFSLGATVVKSQSLCSLQPQNEAREVILFEFF